METWPWMEWYFHDWIDYNGVTHFRDFGGLKILESADLRMGIFAVKNCYRKSDKYRVFKWPKNRL